MTVQIMSDHIPTFSMRMLDAWLRHHIGSAISFFAAVIGDFCAHRDSIGYVSLDHRGGASVLRWHAKIAVLYFHGENQHGESESGRCLLADTHMPRIVSSSWSSCERLRMWANAGKEDMTCKDALHINLEADCPALLPSHCC